MGTLSEFEQLQTEKNSLEEEAAHLEDEQKQLKAMLRTAYEKTIQELKNKNGANREINGELQTKLDGLQAELNKLSMTDDVLEKVGIIPSGNGEEPKVSNEASESSGEDSSLSARKDNESAEISNKEQDSKRHRFF